VSDWKLVAGKIGPWDPPGLLGEIRKGVVSAASAPTTEFESHKERPEVIADRVIALRSVRDTVRQLEAVREHLQPIQPNSMGMTSYELGWADCQAKIRAAIDRAVSPVDGDDDGDDGDDHQDIK
jgi:hypothetical protein